MTTELRNGHDLGGGCQSAPSPFRGCDDDGFSPRLCCDAAATHLGHRDHRGWDRFYYVGHILRHARLENTYLKLVLKIKYIKNEVIYDTRLKIKPMVIFRGVLYTVLILCEVEKPIFFSNTQITTTYKETKTCS